MAGPLAWTASKVGGLGNGGNESKMTGESQSCSTPEAGAAKFKVIRRLVFINQVLFAAQQILSYHLFTSSCRQYQRSMEETVEDLWVRGVKIWGKALKLASPGT
ncbi:hypothetical protein SLE2022_276140 [Rubroshorea leprosula]